MYQEIAEETLRSGNHIWQNLKGAVHIKKGKEWMIALSVVKSFLEQYQMTNTLSVISSELRSESVKTDQGSVLSFLDNLLEIRRRLKTSNFQDKLQKFKKNGMIS
jgi:hypothetical protein